MKANPKDSGSLPLPWSGHATTIIEFFAHLLESKKTQISTKI